MEDTAAATGTKKNRVHGFARFGSDSLTLILMLAIIAASTMAVVWPLWLLATRATSLYTFLCLLGVFAVICALVVSRVKAKSRASSL